MGRPKYKVNIPNGVFTFQDLNNINGCSELTLHKWIYQDRKLGINSKVVTLPGKLPNDFNHGKRLDVFVLRSQMESVDVSFLEPVKSN